MNPATLTCGGYFQILSIGFLSLLSHSTVQFGVLVVFVLSFFNLMSIDLLYFLYRLVHSFYLRICVFRLMYFYLFFKYDFNCISNMQYNYI